MVETKSKWNSNFAFLMAMIGSAVGLGNIWRYPYVLYSNGGGSFLIPYIIAIVVLGFSCVLLEYAVGYKFKTSLLDIYYTINKKFKLFGWFVVLICFLILTYYLCIVGWDLIYLCLSFFKGWGANPNAYFATSISNPNGHLGGIFDIVPIVFVSCLIIWVITWYISHKNINDGISRLCNIFIPFLFIVIIGIAIYSLTLKGASIGLANMFTPDWSQLLNLNIWLAAFGQVLFSLSIGMGIAITYSSYIDDDVSLTKNAATVVVSNSAFEVINAVGVFSILGFMSFMSGRPFDSLIVDGTSLAFVAFPMVFNIMGGVAYIIGPLFFFCILIAGITSAVAVLETMVSSFITEYGFSRKKAVTILCIVGFCITSLFTTGLGSFILGIFDRILNNFAIILAAILECIIFGWYYKIDDLVDVLNKNSNVKIVRSWWKYLIKIILPVILFILWFVGLKSTFAFSSILELFIIVGLLLILIIVPFVLTYFSKKISKSI